MSTSTTRPTGLGAQLLRRKPVGESAHPHGPQLTRSIGTFQLTMFGVGATIGTGIFFVLGQAVPEAGPAVVVSFILAGIAAGLAAAAGPVILGLASVVPALLYVALLPTVLLASRAGGASATQFQVYMAAMNLGDVAGAASAGALAATGLPMPGCTSPHQP